MVDTTLHPKVLVIGGDQAAEHRLFRLLRMDGYDVRWVADRPAAFSAIDEQAPALVVIMAAPGADEALDLCRDLRTSTLTRRAAIVIHSDANTVELRVAAAQAGADEFLARPYTSTAFRAGLRSLLELKGRPGSDAGIRRTSRRSRELD